MFRRWMHYPLLEGEGDGGGGGDPPEDPPAGDPPPEGDPPPTTISLESLPEELRDRPEAEIKFLLEHMATSLGTRTTQISELKDELAELRGAVSAQPPADPDPDDEKPLEELILEDSGKAIERYLISKGYIGAMGELSERVGEAEYSMVAGKVDDFDAHEEKIRKLLKEGKIPATRLNIMGAYTMSLGEAVLAERARDVRSNSGGIPPTPPAPPEGEEPESKLSSLEREIMLGHGYTDEADWIKYRDNPPELKLPT